MATKNISEQEKRDLEAFARLAEGMESRRKELLAEAHLRAEMELHQYRMTVLNKLDELTQRHSVSQIVRITGLARSTVYRWMERLRQERIIAEAAAKGIEIQSLGTLGGFGSSPATGAAQAALVPEVVEKAKRSFEELGWRNAKKTASGEIGGTDAKGDVWLFNDDGEAWNKTKNETFDGRENWPEGAEELVDSLK